MKQLGARRPIRRRALGVVLCDEVAQLLDDGVDEFLPVSVRLPELGKDVVLSAHLSHPGEQEEERRGGEMERRRAKVRGARGHTAKHTQERKGKERTGMRRNQRRKTNRFEWSVLSVWHLVFCCQHFCVASVPE